MKSWGISMLVGLVIVCAGEAWSNPPMLPHTFWGIVKKDGQNVVDGTPVSARINGVEYVSSQTLTWGADSVYTFNVPGDDTDTPTKEGGVEGETIRLYV